MNAMCEAFIHPQAMKPARPEMLTNQLKTVVAVELSLRNPSRPKAAVKATAMYGTPPFVVIVKNLGAWPSLAKPTRIREPE